MEPIRIDTAFPGGNVVVESIDGCRITLKKEIRDTQGDWFYWSFRVVFPARGTYTFHFSNGFACGPRGPAVSYDNGFSWQWLGAESVSGKHDTFTYMDDGSRPGTVMFCMGMQYQMAHLDDFCKRHAASPYLTCDVLTTSRKGREVPFLHIADPAAKARKRIFLTSRHHCCEMMATYALEGLLETALQDDDTGRALRSGFIIDAVPFVDFDGVLDGDQGKNRIPHDHEYDYGAVNLYPETAEIQRFLQEHRSDYVLDMHCPWIFGGVNETIFFPGPKDKTMERRLNIFSGLVAAAAPPEAPVYSSDNVLYGTSWNVDENYKTAADGEASILAGWAVKQGFPKLSLVLEIAYANARDVTLCPDSVRALGRAVAGSILKFDGMELND